jgi:hypothetical protein
MFTEIFLFESHVREASFPKQAAARIKERHDQVRQTTKQHAIFTKELQGALGLKVEFSKTYCKLMMR